MLLKLNVIAQYHLSIAVKEIVPLMADIRDYNKYLTINASIQTTHVHIII